MAQKVVGLILAGGEGRRMGYQNKGLLPFQGRSLVAHVVDRIAPQVDQLYLSANRDLESYKALDLPVISDDPQWQGSGPLAGIASLLPYLEEDQVVQIVSCDGPFIPMNLVEMLGKGLNLLQREDLAIRAVYPSTKERGHYLYMQALAGDLQVVESVLAAGDLRIRALLKQLSAAPIYFENEAAFINCNRPQDLNMLERVES